MSVQEILFELERLPKDAIVVNDWNEPIKQIHVYRRNDGTIGVQMSTR